MNADFKKIIEIAKNPKIQELIRRVWPDDYWTGYVFNFRKGKIEYVSKIDLNPDAAYRVPFGFDEEHACSQIDVLLMAKIIRYESLKHTVIAQEFYAWKQSKHFSIDTVNHSDLYLKLLWLEEMMEASDV